MPVVSSQVRLINQALMLLGENIIQSLEEDSPEAKAADTFFPDARDHCLRDLKPSFAKKRSGVLVALPTPAFEYRYASELPQDCLAVVSLNYTDNTGDSVTNRMWTIEGRTILTQKANIKIAYIATSPDIEGIMDSSFVKALAAYLAYEMAYPLTNDTKKIDAMVALYGIRADDARAVYGLESSTIQTINTQLLQVR